MRGWAVHLDNATPTVTQGSILMPPGVKIGVPLTAIHLVPDSHVHGGELMLELDVLVEGHKLVQLCKNAERYRTVQD